MSTRRPSTRMWLKMGAELEGGWSRDSRAMIASLIRGSEAKGDSSVQEVSGDRGEITTPPLAILDDLCDAIKTMYPDHVNSTCGFHLHTSFLPVNASFLASTDFFNYFLARWEKWAKETITNDRKGYSEDNTNFWYRWKGNSKYCKKVIDAHSQLIDHGGDKYRMLNFLPWHRIRTIECRILPQFVNVDVAISATRELSDIYDTYLNENTHFIKLMEETEVKDGVQIIHQKEYEAPDTNYFEIIKEQKGVKHIPTGEDVYYSLGKDSTPHMAPHGIPYSEEIE